MSKNNVSVPAVFARSGTSGTAQSERMSQESKNAWKDAKDDDIGVHLEADEQALRRTEEALLFKQFQVEDEEMAREALGGKKRKKNAKGATRAEKRLEDEMEEESRGVEKRLDDDMEEESRGAKHAQWLSMFGIKIRSERLRKPEPDLLLEAAQMIAEKYLRDQVTLPADPDDTRKSLPRQNSESGGWLPLVSCGFLGCDWNDSTINNEFEYEDDPEHPCDQRLRAHVISKHGHTIHGEACKIIGQEKALKCRWDIYKEALAVKERKSIPVAGASVDRRVCEATARVFNDACVRALICSACARVKVDTGGLRSEIEFITGKWLFSLPPGSLVKNFSMAEFKQRYCKSGTPLAERGSRPGSPDGPDFSDWKLNLHAQYLQLLQDQDKRCKDINFEDPAIQIIELGLNVSTKHIPDFRCMVLKLENIIFLRDTKLWPKN